MNSIEAQRLVLEELDTIENAIARRLRRDPQLLVQKSPAGDLLLLLRQHELKVFQDRYSSLVSTFLALGDARNGVPDPMLSRLSDPTASFAGFDKTFAEINLSATDFHAEDINRLYAPYTSASLTHDTDDQHIKRFTSRRTNRERRKIQKKFLMSEIASNVTVEGMFSQSERNGRVFDLKSLFDKYKLSEESYLDFLKSLKDKQPRAAEFYTDLVVYLRDFISRTQPLVDEAELREKLRSQFESGNNIPRDQSIDEDGRVFCRPCEKWFSKMTVYSGHLSGKKHKSKKSGNQLQSIHVDNDSGSPKYAEYEAFCLLLHLENTLTATIADAERQATMTGREREMELQEKQCDSGEEYITMDESGQSDEEISETDEFDEFDSKSNLPIGPDGLPMPLWLYKLQGLHKTYTCQICGNLEYRGRTLFEKHFALAKHYTGLKFLGVPDYSMHLFLGISDIKEAEQFLMNLRNSERSQRGVEEDVIEVEDELGNVMSRSDYDELKKQGLL